jgi:hypothetical protein
VVSIFVSAACGNCLRAASKSYTRAQSVRLHETKNANGAGTSDKQTKKDPSKDVTEAVNKARLNAEEVSAFRESCFAKIN